MTVVEHDARPFDGHTYRLTLAGPHSGELQEVDAVARWSYSAANVVFAVIDEHGRWTGRQVSELSMFLTSVHRITDQPSRALAQTPTCLARPDLDPSA